jgi:exopolyphosphatase/pppGpp-phosphohydrolase
MSRDQSARRLSDDQEAAISRVLATTSDWALGHVHQVERVAVWLYDALREFHGYGADEETLLRAAALLHDVGYPVDPDRHHKISARIIRTQLGPPFAAEQVELVALLARYHRKALPKLAHRRYRSLDDRSRRIVLWVGGILRVADGLDRAHDSRVQRVRVGLIDNRIEIRVGTGGRALPARATVEAIARSAGGFADFPASPVAGASDLETDVAGAMRKRNLLERALGMPVLVRAG